MEIRLEAAHDHKLASISSSSGQFLWSIQLQASIGDPVSVGVFYGVRTVSALKVPSLYQSLPPVSFSFCRCISNQVSKFV